MGNITFKMECKGETQLKLEATKIKEFSGVFEDWPKMKSRTVCTFSGSGCLKVMDDERYAQSNEEMNSVVYSQLTAATIDGVAHHLIAEYEEAKDGHAAWKSLCAWYDGDMIKNETADKIRTKLSNLQLHSGITGSEYTNKFMELYRDLARVPGEGYTPSHAVYLFLKNIIDPEYKVQVALMKSQGANLKKCIVAIQKQEQELQQRSVEKRRLQATMRRMKEDLDGSDTDEPSAKRAKKMKVRRVYEGTESENCKFEGELKTTEKGLLRFEGSCWKKMDEKEKQFVREYNASVRHGDTEKVKMLPGIVVKTKLRRTQVMETDDIYGSKNQKKKGVTHGRKKKGVTFGVTDADHGEDEE